MWRTDEFVRRVVTSSFSGDDVSRVLSELERRGLASQFELRALSQQRLLEACNFDGGFRFVLCLRRELEREQPQARPLPLGPPPSHIRRTDDDTVIESSGVTRLVLSGKRTEGFMTRSLAQRAQQPELLVTPGEALEVLSQLDTEFVVKQGKYSLECWPASEWRDLLPEGQAVAPLLRNLEGPLQWRRPLSVQKYCVEALRTWRRVDVMVETCTGSGKSGAYLVPIIADLLSNPAERDTNKSHSRGQTYPTAVVTVPTRSLAEQVARMATMLCHGTNISVSLLYGGTSRGDLDVSFAALPDILVATPGRLWDHVKRKTSMFNRVFLRDCRWFVMDELDVMLDMSHGKDIFRINEESKNTSPHRRTLCFTATLTESLREFAQTVMRDTLYIGMPRMPRNVLTEHSFVLTQRHQWIKKTVETVRRIWRDCLSHQDLTERKLLVFCNRIRDCSVLLDELRAQIRIPGVCMASFHSGDEVPQGHRELTLEAFRDSTVHLLVTTDVLQRGIEVPHVYAILQAQLPSKRREDGVSQNVTAKKCFHAFAQRAGRCGRRGTFGKCISLLRPHLYNEVRIYPFLLAELLKIRRFRSEFLRAEDDESPPIPEFLLRALERHDTFECMSRKLFSDDEVDLLDAFFQGMGARPLTFRRTDGSSDSDDEFAEPDRLDDESDLDMSEPESQIQSDTSDSDSDDDQLGGLYRDRRVDALQAVRAQRDARPRFELEPEPDLDLDTSSTSEHTHDVGIR